MIGPATRSVTKDPTDDDDGERDQSPVARRGAAEDERDRGGEVAADDERHHDQERRSATGVTWREWVDLHDGELLMCHRSTGSEGIREAIGHDRAGRGHDEERRSARGADERTVDPTMVDRVPRRRLVGERDELEPDLLRHRGGKRRWADDADLEVARLRGMQRPDVRADECRLHEKYDEQRQPEQLVAGEPRRRLDHRLVGGRIAGACVVDAHLTLRSAGSGEVHHLTREPARHARSACEN